MKVDEEDNSFEWFHSLLEYTRIVQTKLLTGSEIMPPGSQSLVRQN